MRDHYGMKKRRVVFTGPEGLAHTGASNKSTRHLISLARSGKIKIHYIGTFKLGELEPLRRAA